MTCRTLRWPVLVEIEKSAKSKRKHWSGKTSCALSATGFGLNDRLVREEPPTLLYEARFPEVDIGKEPSFLYDVHMTELAAIL